MAKKNAVVGRPPKYKNCEEIQMKIDDYFKECEGKVLLDDKKHAVTDKYGNPIIVGAKPPTVTGLALALGFATRKSLLEYQGKKEFVNTITRAKTRIEQYAEERLFDRDGAAGAKFSLANNFSGWKEKQEVDVSGTEAAQEKLSELLEQRRKRRDRK